MDLARLALSRATAGIGRLSTRAKCASLTFRLRNDNTADSAPAYHLVVLSSRVLGKGESMRFVRVRRTPAMIAAICMVVAIMGIILVGCGSTTTTTAPAGSDTTAAGTSSSDTTVRALTAALTGAGATFPEPLYVEWAGEFGASVQPGVSINYQGVGSGGGIQQFTAMTVDFGASDAP